jgi:hypothetical protein
VEEILHNELDNYQKSQTSYHDRSTAKHTLDIVEQNAVRYVAGSVIRKLLEKEKADEEKIECLAGLLVEHHEDNHDTCELWLLNTNRGGLLRITDRAFDFFYEVEVICQNSLLSMDTQSLCERACLDRYVIEIWSELSIDIKKDKQDSLLHDIVNNWLILRSHAKASMLMETHKRSSAKNKGSKSLRKNLKRLSNQN